MRWVLVLVGLLFAGRMVVSVGVAGMGVLVLVFAVAGSAFSSRRASLGRFLRDEHRAGRLASLVLTLQTSRDWAVGWVGARFLRHPALQVLSAAAITLFWPVFSFALLTFNPAVERGMNPVRFVLVPSVGIFGVLAVAVFYLVGDAILTLFFDLSDLVYDLPMRERMATSIGNSVGGTLYAAYAWFVPVLFGLVGQEAGKWLPTVLGLDEGWRFSARFLGFVAFYAPGSCVCQWVVLRKYWRGVQAIFLASVTARAQTLEERGTGGE